MPELKPEDLVKAMRKIVQTLRYGPRELTLATFGLLLLALPNVLPEPLPKGLEFLKPVLAWIPWAGGLLLALAAWLIWKKVVAPIPEGKPKPPAIKGPAPFDPNDAELFARLGRKDDLDRLRAWILDDQKPLVALMGESGVGKTSLLRAGLENHLKGDAVQVIYWEALPTNPEEGLLHAVQSRWGDSASAPASFARLASMVAKGKRVVVIDQAEQLSPDRHPAVFEMLRQVATASPPYAATWVVAFRREYMPVWRDFELGLPEPAQRRLETLSLRRFLPEQAERVIAVLAEEGGLPIEQKVVKALVESIESEGRVTPADIGISLLVLSEISGNGHDSAFTIEDFRERGGQAGLLTRYLEGLLEQFPEAERREIFLGLLSLINPDNDQRLAEGRTSLELETSARPASPPRFAAVLRFLASGKARILEEVPEPPLRYRLIHERLIPAIRRLTGVLGAEAEQASRLLERAYRIWSRDRKSRYLLSGRELRQVLKFRGQLAWGDETDQKRAYLRLARKHRNRLWVSSAIVSMSLGLGIYLYSEHRSQVAAERALLTSWELPLDLPDHMHQLEQLTLPKVTRVDWLKKAHRLRSLEIEFAKLPSLEGLPEGLRALDVKSSQISELPRLPVGLVSLAIDMSFHDPEKIPYGLSSLEIFCDTHFLNRAHLPDSLKSLTLILRDEDKNLRIDLSHLKNLKSLSVYTSRGVRLTLALSKNLRSLKINTDLENWQDLPSGLESLDCYCNPESGLLPKTLKRLHINSEKETEIKIVGPPLYTLSTQKRVLPQIPFSSLVGLSLRNADQSSFSQFPTLNALQLEGSGSIEAKYLPQGLEVLKFVGVGARFPQGLPNGLRHLDLAENQASLPDLPEGLESLTYLGPLQAPLPASLRSLTIRINDQNMPFLAPLYALNKLQLHGKVTKIPSHLGSLIELDISHTYISTLQGLPPDLISLTLRTGQVSTLKGLPKSVVSLQFRSPDFLW